MKAQGVGTWGTLLGALGYMEQNELGDPAMFAQGYHIERVTRQAALLGIRSIVPKGLPTAFDRDSDQLWTRSRWIWTLANGAGSLLLKWRGQL